MSFAIKFIKPPQSSFLRVFFLGRRWYPSFTTQTGVFVRQRSWPSATWPSAGVCAVCAKKQKRASFRMRKKKVASIACVRAFLDVALSHASHHLTHASHVTRHPSRDFATCLPSSVHLQSASYNTILVTRAPPFHTRTAPLTYADAGGPLMRFFCASMTRWWQVGTFYYLSIPIFWYWYPLLAMYSYLLVKGTFTRMRESLYQYHY